MEVIKQQPVESFTEYTLQEVCVMDTLQYIEAIKYFTSKYLEAERNEMIADEDKNLVLKGFYERTMLICGETLATLIAGKR